MSGDFASFQSQLDRHKTRMLMGTAPALITAIDDSGPISKVQVRINDTPEIVDGVPVMQFYGISTIAPVESDATGLFITGQRANPIIIGTNNQKARLRDQKPGEVAIFTDEGDKITFNRGNKINVVSKDTVNVTPQNNFSVDTKDATIKASDKIKLDTPLVEITGNLKVDGTIEAGGGYLPLIAEIAALRTLVSELARRVEALEASG